MKQKATPSQPENPGRREALRRLAGAVTAAYVVPEILFLSAARADNSSSSSSAPSASDSTSSSATIPSSPSTGSDEDEDNAAADYSDDSCNLREVGSGNTISISRSDLSRSQEAIRDGYAKPLDQIWGAFSSNYSGRVVGVAFTGGRRNARYHFRSISARGRLETVVVSAQTGEILRIVGC